MNQVACFLVASVCLLSSLPNSQAADIDFAHDIAPILKTHCAKCHAGEKKQGGLSMDTHELLLAGGESGVVVKPGDSSNSLLIERITEEDEALRMPPETSALPPEAIEKLKQWIDAGVSWEPGFALTKGSYEPPLRYRRPELPAATSGRNHPIDRIIDAYFAANEIESPADASDAAFIRRVSLDVIGLLPARDELHEFMTDTNPSKRSELIDSLLANDLAYAEHWLTFWNDLLRNDYTGTGFITGGRQRITKWLYNSLLENKPYDEFARELIDASPDSVGFIKGIRWRGNVSASQREEIQFAQNVSQAFLGINMKCASCHDSFIDRWKLDETYGLAAIYATEPLTLHRCDKALDKTATPAWIFPELGQVDAAADQATRMKQLAALLTHEDNGRFARTIVNRIWHRLMGRGIVHPVDAMHTEPWSEDLLDYLALHLRDNGFDLKQTIGLICTSQIYQSQTPSNDESSDAAGYVFRGPRSRRMTAEQFMDTVWQLTESAPAKYDAQVLRYRLASLLPSGEKVRMRGDSSNGLASELPSPQPSPASGRGRGRGSDLPTSPLTAQWIWSNAEASGPAPAGQTITLRHQFELSRLPSLAAGVITCDNSYRIYLNGRHIGDDDNWETVEIVSLMSALRKGKNELLIEVANGGASPNPAAMIFEARLRFDDDTNMSIASGPSWDWTKRRLNARGRFGKTPDDWQPAQAVNNQLIWIGRVGAQLESLLATAANSPLMMVRASLVKNNAFMKALGRPNRDQIVTSRPAELTTLEAIDLANGQTLADAIQKGAQVRFASFAESPAVGVTWLYESALSRPPTTEELEASVEYLGSAPTEEAVEDVLWSVIMLPEFQIVR